MVNIKNSTWAGSLRFPIITLLIMISVNIASVPKQHHACIGNASDLAKCYF